MITRVLIVLNTIVLLILLAPRTAGACGISYQNGATDPTSGCATTPPIVGAGALAAAVALIVTLHTANSLARGASTGLDAMLISDALALADVAPPLQQSLAEATQLAAQGAQSASTAVAQAQQAAQAADKNQLQSAQRAADAAAALTLSAWEGAETAAQAALTVARAADDLARTAPGPASKPGHAAHAAHAAADAARNTATAAARARQQTQLAYDAVAKLAHAQTPAQAVVAANELNVAAATAAHAAQTAADNATVTAHAAALTEARVRGTALTVAGLSGTEIHDGALRAVIPSLHTLFANAYVYGDVIDYSYLSYENPHNEDPVIEELAGASQDHPGKNPGYPDIAVHLGTRTYVYEVKIHNNPHGLTQKTKNQIARYVGAFRRVLRPHGVRADFGPDLPVTVVVAVDPETGLIYRLFSKRGYPGVIFYAVA